MSRPELTITDNGDGESVTVAVTGSNPASTNTIFYMPRLGGEWEELGDFTGDDEVEFDLAGGLYWGMLESVAGEATTVCASIIPFGVVPPIETASILGRYMTEAESRLTSSGLFRWVGKNMQDIPAAVAPSCLIKCEEDPEDNQGGTNLSIHKKISLTLRVFVRDQSENAALQLAALRDSTVALFRSYVFTSETGHYDLEVIPGAIREAAESTGFSHASDIRLDCHCRVLR